MPEIGQSLSHYSIVEKIGKGGMGEVYRAKDQVLGRDVAIKVLPEEFAKDADRVARFQREAKLLASLNHSNIASIYGLEEAGGTSFLVMELVEGQTLADRIKAGAIPVEESLKLALQIAEALEAAHEKGVIHRDLKPANIKVTPDGKVKVLDFGLAKAFAGDQAEVNLSHSPTLSYTATQQGVILGTAAYMSPEQAKGKTVDKRADIWAFGAVLFEMLTGRPAFPGDEVSEILASVIKGDVNLDLLPANVHPRVREVVTRCLQKDLRSRYSDIADVRYEIELVIADPVGLLEKPIMDVGLGIRMRLLLPWMAIAIVLAASVTGVAVWNLKPMPAPERRQVIRFDYDLPESQQFVNIGHPFLAISPDGSKFAYNTAGGLYLRSMNEPVARLILGPDKDPRQPFFSRDGQWVGYWSGAENQLKKISVSGGVPVTIANASNPVLPSWCMDDTIVYCQFGTNKIMRVAANGGEPELLCEAEGNKIFAPQILPGGKFVLYSQLDGSEFRIMVQSLKTGQCKSLMPMQGTVSRYLPTGHIVYMVGHDLFAVPFDPVRLEMIGRPVCLVEGILWTGSTAAPQYAISDSGTLVYAMGMENAAALARTLVWVNREGQSEPVAAPSNIYDDPKISPDGSKVALTINTGGNLDIHVFDFNRGILSRLTSNRSIERYPVWTPDGNHISFTSNRDGVFAVYCKAFDGTGKDEKLGSTPDRFLFPWAFSSDGKTLVVSEPMGGLIKWDIGTLSVERNHTPNLLLHEDYSVFQPKISPDGRWIAYAADESGKDIVELYVRPFPEVGKSKWQVSTGGGHSPLWSPDGQELYFRNGDAVMAVRVKTKPAFSLETPKILFRGTYLSSAFLAGNWSFSTWDISPDGKRFLMIKEAEPDTAGTGGLRKINIVLNWTEELKQRVPVK
jgi:Tol biopolymer transport system component